MAAWIQTTAGSLIRGEAVTHVSVRQTPTGWEVGVSAAAAPAAFASLDTLDAANMVRNRIAMELDLANAQSDPALIAWAEDKVNVSMLAVA